MQQKIFLTTTVDWPSAARLAGAFTEVGASVDALFPRGHVLGVSRYPERAYRYRPLHAMASLLGAIEAAEPDIVIPCDDRALAQLLALAASDTDLYTLMMRSLGDIDSYVTLLARSASIAVAREEGIIAPLTLAVSDEDALVQAISEAGLPCVLKADGSWGGSGVIVARTLDDARVAFRWLQGPPSRTRSLVRAALRKDLHFIAEAWSPRKATVNVQAFVPGRPATSVFACRDGELLASFHMDVAEWAGAAGPASLMRRVHCPHMEEAARRIAGRFKLSGLIGLDFVRDDQGVPHLIEINPRATQICHLALGPDLPAALIGAPPRPPVTDKPLIALFPQLLTQPTRSPEVFEDMPWDDPAILRALAGEEGPDPQELAAEQEFISELVRTDCETPAFGGRRVYGPRPR